ncbi:LLM class flavin-dependent oxidoreductase, partial [Candidatus Amarolinea dominans]|uniref:LLM class flavin-dependent oxidoreductase n=1 Tax=Candidatus Amarolinea dominans TaxID=3140696 RepID=UPI0031CC55C0
MAYGKPLGKTRSMSALYVTSSSGVSRWYLTANSPDSTEADPPGAGQAVEDILHGRPDPPIYLAAIGPKNVEMAAEIADCYGCPSSSPPITRTYQPQIEAGFAKAGGGRAWRTWRCPSVPVSVG